MCSIFIASITSNGVPRSTLRTGRRMNRDQLAGHRCGQLAGFNLCRCRLRDDVGKRQYAVPAVVKHMQLVTRAHHIGGQRVLAEANRHAGDLHWR